MCVPSTCSRSICQRSTRISTASGNDQREKLTSWILSGMIEPPLGVNKMGMFMKELSKDANLSRIYTNHSIHATCITHLDQAGFESCHIMAVSSHKSETTVKTYAKKCPETKKRVMSTALDNKITPKPAKVAKTDPETPANSTTTSCSRNTTKLQSRHHGSGCNG